jgi:hypothetical protein
MREERFVDRSKGLLTEAARLRERAKELTDAHVRAELIRLADRYTQLAQTEPRVDIGIGSLVHEAQAASPKRR